MHPFTCHCYLLSRPFFSPEHAGNLLEEFGWRLSLSRSSLACSGTPSQIAASRPTTSFNLPLTIPSLSSCPAKWSTSLGSSKVLRVLATTFRTRHQHRHLYPSPRP